MQPQNNLFLSQDVDFREAYGLNEISFKLAENLEHLAWAFFEPSVMGGGG